MAQARFNCSRRPGLRGGHGFSLIEVVISMGLLTVVSLGVAQLFAASTRSNLIARGQTSTTALAEQKLEQLRSLTWGFDLDGTGLPVSDTTSNLAVHPPTQAGTGLNPSPTDSLDRNIPGFVDFIDAQGEWVGTGSTPPATAAFVRRWSIQPLPSNPNNTLILQVLVTPLSNEQARIVSAQPRTRMAGDALLVSVKTRKSS
ncbi:MAG TPA: prepilin-type N-terminal cleavage/methylation domain-containing protein [Vicinamibacterales bacterium]|nr:prepilin-type N-terminal cleavage/methylation domain-containing protein [Vicinamibacterales bacterium]